MMNPDKIFKDLENIYIESSKNGFSFIKIENNQTI